MPKDKSSSDNSNKSENKNDRESQSSGRIPMGVKSQSCDDGKVCFLIYIFYSKECLQIFLIISH